MTEKHAAMILAFNDKGEVLAVSRRDNFHDYGLPGGKLDIDESSLAAAVRETFEETGLMPAFEPVEVFSEFDGEYVSSTFLAETMVGTLKRERGGGFPRWVHPRRILEGSFGEYNKKLFEKIGFEVKPHSSQRQGQRRE